MADITVENNIFTSHVFRWNSRSLVWTSPTTGYMFFITEATAEDLVYRKTTDSGATWGARQTIKSGTIRHMAIWYDKWTTGDSGDVIHIAYVDKVSNDCLYNSFSVSDDTLDGEVSIFNGASAADTPDFDDGCISIIKSRGGSVFAGGWIDSAGENFFAKATTSPATSFSSKTSMADGNQADRIMFSCGGETDGDDIHCIYMDVVDSSSSNITLKVYDDSLNTWSESATITTAVENGAEFPFDCATRHSDNHTILLVYNDFGSTTGDLECWDITNSTTFSQKTNPITNNNGGAPAILINQQNDDLYAFYADGSWASVVDVEYFKSTDGGTNWGTTQTMSADTGDDFRNILAGTSVGSDGGRVQPLWFDDDDQILFTNTDNSVEITAAAGGTNTSINIGDAWKSVSSIKVNIGDSWKTASSVKVNIGDAWKTIF